MKVDLQILAEKWGSPLVARCEIGKFSGGILNPRSLANLDCKGAGPRGRVRIGGKVAYPTEELVAWLEARAVEL